MQLRTVVQDTHFNNQQTVQESTVQKNST